MAVAADVKDQDTGQVIEYLLELITSGPTCSLTTAQYGQRMNADVEEVIEMQRHVGMEWNAPAVVQSSQEVQSVDGR